MILLKILWGGLIKIIIHNKPWSKLSQASPPLIVSYSHSTLEHHILCKCIYCTFRQSGHQCAACTIKIKISSVSNAKVMKGISSLPFHQSFTPPVTVDYKERLNYITALVDSSETIPCMPSSNITAIDNGNRHYATNHTSDSINCFIPPIKDHM